VLVLKDISGIISGGMYVDGISCESRRSDARGTVAVVAVGTTPTEATVAVSWTGASGDTTRASTAMGTIGTAPPMWTVGATTRSTPPVWSFADVGRGLRLLALALNIRQRPQVPRHGR
jgi:hypothetical protein